MRLGLGDTPMISYFNDSTDDLKSAMQIGQQLADRDRREHLAMSAHTTRWRLSGTSQDCILRRHKR